MCWTYNKDNFTRAVALCGKQNRMFRILHRDMFERHHLNNIFGGLFFLAYKAHHQLSYIGWYWVGNFVEGAMGTLRSGWWWEGCSFSNNNITKLYSNAQNFSFSMFFCIKWMGLCVSVYLHEWMPISFFYANFIGIPGHIQFWILIFYLPFSNSSVSFFLFGLFFSKISTSTYSIGIWQEGTSNMKSLFPQYLSFSLSQGQEGSKIELLKCT